MNARQLIVTADDFGIGLQTSAGIIEAHLHGPVTCTSLMVVRGDRARRSVELLSKAPELEVGLHLVLSGTGEMPLTKPACLVNKLGHFLPLGKLAMRAWRRKLERAQVLDEIAAQAREFEKLMGRKPAYVDAHHHSHELPMIRQVMVEAVNAKILPDLTRVSIEPESISHQVAGASFRRAVARALGRAARDVFGAGRMHFNDAFFGMLSPKQLTQRFPWQAYFDQLPADGTLEWVVHPGLADPELMGRDTYVKERVAELAALIDPNLRSKWEDERRMTKSKALER